MHQIDIYEFGIFQVGLELNKGSPTLRDQRLILTYGPYLPSLLYCEPKLQQFYRDKIENPQKPDKPRIATGPKSADSDSGAPRGPSDINKKELYSQMPCGNTAPCFNLCDSKRTLLNQLNASGNSIQGIIL